MLGACKCGLGAGSPYQIAESVAPLAASVGTTAGLVASGALAGSVAGPVGAIAGIVVALALKLGEGCGNACVEASKALQVYEVAVQDILNVAAGGYISGSTAAQMVSGIIQVGIQALGTLQSNGDPKAKGGIDLLNQEMSGSVGEASSYGPATKPYNSSIAQILFMSPSTPNWYSDSIVAGNNLASQVLNSSLTNMVSSFTSNSSLLWIAAIGLIVLGLL